MTAPQLKSPIILDIPADGAALCLVRGLVEKHQLEILVRDFGCRADVGTLKPPQLEDVRPGRLGLHFMQSAMDRLSYESRSEGGTLFRRVKFRKKQKASSGGTSC